MLSGRGGAGMSRSTRQSLVGLFLLGSVALFVGLIFWLRDFDPTRRSYRAFIDFDDASGMGVGTPVSYRGVKVGQVTGIRPQPEGVVIEVEFTRTQPFIPSNAVIESNQAGLVGETSINITPLQSLPSEQDIPGPLAKNCDPDLIICNGSRLQGQAQLDVNALIRATLRIANLLSDPQLTANINSVAQNASDALSAVSDLSNDVSGLTARVNGLLASDALGTTLGTVNTTLGSVGQAANEVSLLASSNRGAIVNTLVSVQQTSDRLRYTLDGLSPALGDADIAGIISNLEIMSVNAAEASANLRDFSGSISDPTNTLMLQQLLDSARSVFQNVQKITSDLDELTGDPSFRNNLRDLIDSLNRLVSSTQQLQQQTQLAHALDSLNVAIEQERINAEQINTERINTERINTEQINTDRSNTEPLNSGQPESVPISPVRANPSPSLSTPAPSAAPPVKSPPETSLIPDSPVEQEDIN